MIFFSAMPVSCSVVGISLGLKERHNGISRCSFISILATVGEVCYNYIELNMGDEAEEKEMWDSNSDDPLTRARGQCMIKDCDVRKIIKELQACQNRIANKPYTAETCQQETTDLVMAVDHCVGHKAFDALK